MIFHQYPYTIKLALCDRQILEKLPFLSFLFFWFMKYFIVKMMKECLFFQIQCSVHHPSQQMIYQQLYILLCSVSRTIFMVSINDYHYKSKSKRQKMNQEEMTCCICKTFFSQNSQPRMMPYCQHSACTNCLKQFITKNKLAIIICQYCGHEEKIAQVDLQYFPKNISLTKILKEKGNCINNSISNQQSSRDTISSGSINNSEKQFCEEHKKKLEIICINDRIKLCPHCALFGSHKDHKFKTISEVHQLMDSRYNQFQSYKTKKVTLDSKINSEEFKQNIIKKIGKEKDRLVSDIKKKFTQITENIKLAEKKAYEDVVKNFKTIYSKITTLIKEENDSQKRYKLWQLKCTQLFEKAQKMKRIEQKVVLYCDGPLQICSEGQTLLNRLQTKINNNINTIQTLISQIRIVQNAGISNSVFNYINVILDDSQTFDELGYVHQEVLTSRQEKETAIRKQQKIQFGADHLAMERASISPTPKRKSKSKDIARVNSDKRSSAKTVSTPERCSVSTMIEQFCQKDNLDTLDLTGYSLSDMEIYDILHYLKSIKKIKGLKLVKNKLTNEGLSKIFQLIPNVTNLNLSFNHLGDDSMISLLDNRQKIPYLRIINLSNNKINERRTKNAIDQLKKQGLIVTI